MAGVKICFALCLASPGTATPPLVEIAQCRALLSPIAALCQSHRTALAECAPRFRRMGGIPPWSCGPSHPHTDSGRYSHCRRTLWKAIRVKAAQAHENGNLDAKRIVEDFCISRGRTLAIYQGNLVKSNCGVEAGHPTLSLHWEQPRTHHTQHGSLASPGTSRNRGSFFAIVVTTLVHYVPTRKGACGESPEAQGPGWNQSGPCCVVGSLADLERGG